MDKRYVFPFVAVVGQEKLKKSLILNLINPKIGGVLICGEKGTAKSTTVRGIEKIVNSVKVVDLPLNVTEDRLIGGIDIEKAIRFGKRHIDEGILKKAHKNILYIDEVNLLSDHIVNTILSVSQSKVNRIDREGLSNEHDSDFILVGSMNPEEGSLRSQFIDRFGLYVDIQGSKEASQRAEIIKRRLEYEKNPEKYISKFISEEEKLKELIESSKKRLEKIKLKDHILNLASQLAQKANCDGHRGEIILVETAKAIAAFDERVYIKSEDLKEASELVLPHRMKNNENNKSDKFDKDNSSKKEHDNTSRNEDENKDKNDEIKDDNNTEENKEQNKLESGNDVEDKESNVDKDNEKEIDNSNNKDSSEDDVVSDIGEIFKVKNISLKSIDKKLRNGNGKRTKTKTTLLQGRYIKYKMPKENVRDLAFDATIRTAAPYQNIRNKNGLALKIDKSDIRERVREKRTGTSILFLVDASGSMGANQRMEAVKGAIISLLTDAYEKRDKVGMISFRKDKAEVLLNITRSVELAKKELKEMSVGGKTPLSIGLEKGYTLLMQEKKKDKDLIPLMVIVSDGRATYSNSNIDPFDEAISIAHKIKGSDIQTIVVDCEQGFIRLEMAKELAKALDSKYYKIDELKQSFITDIVKEVI